MSPPESHFARHGSGHLGDKKVAAGAYGELVEKFPDVARNLEDSLRKWWHFDHWVEATPEGLEKARKAAG